MQWLTALMTQHPELGVYLAIGVGYWVGALRLRGFSLGGVMGALLVGMVLGWLFQVPVSETAQSIVFLLFLFAVGYQVGPRFASAMRGDGWRYAALGIFVPVVGLLVAWLVAKLLDLDPGLAAGMMAGALTESPAIGTATDAIQALPLEAATRDLLASHVGVGYALCYVPGGLVVILVCTVIGPRLLGIDLRREALAMEAEYGITRNRADVFSAWRPFETRAFRLHPGGAGVGRTIGAVERLAQDARLFVLKIRRDGKLLEATPDLVLAAGDVIAVNGRREHVVKALGGKGEEVDDPALLDIPIASIEVFVRRGGLTGRELADVLASGDARSVFVQSITRHGMAVPVGARTRIERGDTVLLVGPETEVLGTAAQLGDVVRPTDATDLVVLGLAIFLGALLGIVVSIPIGQISISIGAAVSTLLAGVVTGHLRARRPLFGRVPDSAVRLMQSLGQAAFVAMVGLDAGPHFLAAVRESGLSLLLGGLVVTLLPLMAGLWFGRSVLRIPPLMLLGALTGSQAYTAALTALQEKADSSIVVIGYSGPIAIAHVLLTTWGTVMVLLM